MKIHTLILKTYFHLYVQNTLNTCDWLKSPLPHLHPQTSVGRLTLCPQMNPFALDRHTNKLKMRRYFGLFYSYLSNSLQLIAFQTFYYRTLFIVKQSWYLDFGDKPVNISIYFKQ